MAQLPNLPQELRSIQVLVRFFLRMVVLLAFAAFGSIGFGRSLVALLWMSTILSAIIGATRTRRVMLAGETLHARTLLEWGFLDEVRPAQELERETLAFAAKLAGQPRDVVAAYQDVFRSLGAGDARKARAVRLAAKRRAAK